MIFEDTQRFRDYLDGYHSSRSVVVTSGGFDPIHVGHLRCISETAKIARKTSSLCVVIVNGDGFLRRKKGRPFMTHSERMEIVSGLAGVDHVVGWDDGSQTVSGCLEILRPKIFTKGGDRSDRDRVPEADVCDRIGCEILFGIGGSDKAQSSSTLISGVAGYDSFDVTVPATSNLSSRVEKPWGSEDIFASTDKYVGKIITVNRDSRLSRQYHEVKDETIYVLQGTLLLELGTDDPVTKVFLSPGDRYRIPTGTVHRFCSWFGTVKLIEVSTPELNDVVRVEDDYGRV